MGEGAFSFSLLSKEKGVTSSGTAWDKCYTPGLSDLEVLKKYPCHLWFIYTSVMGFLAELWDLGFSMWVLFSNFTLCMMLKKYRLYLPSEVGEAQTSWDSRLNSLQVLRLQLQCFLEKTFHFTLSVMFERTKIKLKRKTFSEKLLQHSQKFHGFPGKKISQF